MVGKLVNPLPAYRRGKPVGRYPETLVPRPDQPAPDPPGLCWPVL